MRRLTMQHFVFVAKLFALILAAHGYAAQVKADSVEIVILHLNDVYEITRPRPQDLGGLTRITTLRNQLRAEQRPGTFSLALHAGDCLSPSALGTARVGGEPLAGKQMVAVMNQIGLDAVTFGNHEFDLTEAQFRKRLAESRFTWVSSNITDRDGNSFPGVLKELVISFKVNAQLIVRVGVFAVTLDSGANKKEKDKYYKYADFLQVAKEQIAAMKDRVDIIIALTHLTISDDIRLAEECPEIALILGGHEHVNNYQTRRDQFAPSICKADSNARSVYLHKLTYETNTKKLHVASNLLTITRSLEEDQSTSDIADCWINRGFDALQKETGRNPRDIVGLAIEEFDGREISVRKERTALTSLIAQAMREKVNDSKLAIYNSGMIRIDDVIYKGDPITEYDLLRILPYGGKIRRAVIKGSVLADILSTRRLLSGNGAFIQASDNVADKDGKIRVDGAEIDMEGVYAVAVNDYLIDGKETEKALDFMRNGSADITVDALDWDLRQALREKFQRTCTGDGLNRVVTGATKEPSKELPCVPEEPSCPPVVEKPWYGWLGSSVMDGFRLSIGFSILPLFVWLSRQVPSRIRFWRQRQRDLNEVDRLVTSSYGHDAVGNVPRTTSLLIWPALVWRALNWRSGLEAIEAAGLVGDRRLDATRLMDMCTHFSAKAAVLQAWSLLETVLVTDANKECRLSVRDAAIQLIKDKKMHAALSGAIPRLEQFRDGVFRGSFSPSFKEAVRFIVIVCKIADCVARVMNSESESLASQSNPKEFDEREKG